MVRCTNKLPWPTFFNVFSSLRAPDGMLDRRAGYDPWVSCY